MSTPSTGSDLPPDVIAALRDQYTLERELGSGGMATVYLAQDLKHKRPVALKLLRPEPSHSLGPHRFRREIETAARLHHPHICSVYDSGEIYPGGGQGPPQLWFTMPFVRGESLRDRLRREGRLPVEEALRITREAAEALQYAHDEGVVHRDIKPENILLSHRGATLVADFGIARLTDSSEEQHLTQGGLAVGTPAYMAPEQAMGEKTVDPRADQYALAVTCYEMLAGTPPFVAPTAAAVIALRFREPTPSVRDLRSDVPPAVDRTLQRALALEPGDRFGSVADFARSLESETAAPAPASRRRRTAFAAIVGLAAVLGVGGFLAWKQARPTTVEARPAASRVLAVLPFENLGDSADAYFAEGVTDEVRTKLAQIGGLEVIARGSSNEYRHSGKAAFEIARELGADYLLSGTVRWEKRPGQASRVRVIPELVDVRPGHAPRTRWGQQFEAAITDVFAVQADIAGKVANALDLALGAGTLERLAARPTQNLEAYTAYLRGKDLRTGENSPEALRGSLAEFEGAVALDPGFAAAWAELGLAQLDAFRHGGSQSKDAEAAGRSVERARALAPGSPDIRLATGRHEHFARGNPLGALAEYRAGLQISPGRADLLSATAEAELHLGRWSEALTDLEHAARLDPRSPVVLGMLSDVYARMGRYREARRGIARARDLRPASMSLAYTNARLAAAEGDLDGVHAILRSMEESRGARAVVAYVALREDLIWALDDERLRLLLRLTPADLDGGRADWALALAETHWLRGDQARARAYGDTAAAEFSALLSEWGDRAGRGQIMALRAMSLAYAGRIAEAVAEGERANEVQPLSQAMAGPYTRYLLARIYLLAGEPEKAIDRIEPILRVPDYFSPAWIGIDPTLAGLKRSARYREVVQ
ncbi:MAG: protein kinase domain-containing protein [Gemmatimonadales bacterium]